VSDADLLEGKARIDGAGIGCGPASAVTLAGLRRMRAEGVVREDERVAYIPPATSSRTRT
jgi:threonine synthase